MRQRIRAFWDGFILGLSSDWLIIIAMVVSLLTIGYAAGAGVFR